MCRSKMRPSVSNMKNIWKMNPCQLCQSEFPGPVLLRRHMQVRHPRDQRTSSSPGSEKRKSASTDGRQSLREKVARTVLQCQYCHHQAKSVTSLARHTTGHTGARKCSQCNRGYAQGSSSSEHYLKLHQASCKGEQKWLAASADTEVSSPPPLLRNEEEHQTLALLRSKLTILTSHLS